jgi:hypothetical protein
MKHTARISAGCLANNSPGKNWTSHTIKNHQQQYIKICKRLITLRRRPPELGDLVEMRSLRQNIGGYPSFRVPDESSFCWSEEQLKELQMRVRSLRASLAARNIPAILKMAYLAQNEKTTWKKMRRAAAPEEKIPPAKLVDLSKFGAVTFPTGVP